MLRCAAGHTAIPLKLSTSSALRNEHNARRDFSCLAAVKAASADAEMQRVVAEGVGRRKMTKRRRPVIRV